MVVNPAAIAAAMKARVLILWLGLASLLGLQLTIGQRLLLALAGVMAVAIEVALAGSRTTPVQRTRYDTAA